MGVARRIAALATAAVTGVLAGCGASPDAGRTTVDWYVTPGPSDSSALARACSGSGVDVRVHALPADADDRHTFLVRTLQADPGSIDLLTLDGASVPELAAAGFLRTQPAEKVTDVLPAAVDAVTHDGDLAAVPWTVDPQLLFFRTVAAERAGIDTSAPVTWDDLIAGADRLGLTVQVDDPDGSGLAQWVTALVASGGGRVDQDLDGDAGRGAASVIEFYRESQVGPGPSDEAVTSFLAGSGGFLVAPASVLADPDLRAVISDVGAVAYPVVTAEIPVAPASTQALAVPRDADQGDEAEGVIDCLTEDATVRALMVSTGLASAKTAALADPTLEAELPTAPQLAAALASPVLPPSTPYWDAIRRAIDETWSPLADVTSERTPVDSQAAVDAAIEGRPS